MKVLKVIGVVLGACIVAALVMQLGGCATFAELRPEAYVTSLGPPDTQTTWDTTQGNYLNYRWKCVNGEYVSLTWELNGWPIGDRLISDLRSPCTD